MKEAFDKNKGPFLNEVKPGERFIGYYVLRRKQLEPFRDPSRGFFLTLILSDRSGQRLGRVWEGAEEAYQDLIEGQILKVDGEAEEYLERIQIRIHRVRHVKENEFDMRDMLPSSERDPDQMLDELNSWIEKISEPNLSQLIKHFFENKIFMSEFTTVPAAKKVHHAFIGGLLEHVLEMLSLAQAVVATYPKMNADLLYTSVFLHDIGKIRQFEWDYDIDYSDEGRLVGHIPITDEMLTKALVELPNFPPELFLQLRHVILSHHGRYEWGSPRRPKTIEAIALHYIDNLSAQVNRFQDILNATQPGKQWSEYDSFLRRQLYSNMSDDSNIEEQSLES